MNGGRSRVTRFFFSFPLSFEFVSIVLQIYNTRILNSIYVPRHAPHCEIPPRDVDRNNLPLHICICIHI